MRKSRSSGTARSTGIDLVFAALPHGHSQRLAATIIKKGVPFVDLGADFRLNDAAAYERWYGHQHETPELLGDFVYGIPELNRGAIKGAKAVAAAGCYATAAILALKPLVDAGLVNPESLIVDAASASAARAAKPRRRRASARSTEAFRPTGCSIIGIRQRWKWRFAEPCCSRRTWCR